MAVIKIAIQEKVGADIDSLIKNLGSKDKDIVASASSELIGLESEATDKLMKALENENEYIRANAALILGDLAVSEAAGLLIKVLKEDKSSRVKVNAIKALANIPTQEDITTSLIKCLEDKAVPVRGEAAETLGIIKAKEAVEPLIKALEDKDGSVRANAAFALGEIGDEKALEPLLKEIKDKNHLVRIKTVKALGLLGNTKAVEALIEAMEDKNAEVRASAALSLGEIGDEKALNALIEKAENKKEDKDVRVEAICALGMLKVDSAIPVLIKLMKDSEEDIRGWSADSIGKIGNPEAIEDLKKSMEKEKNTGVKEKLQSAITSLENLIEKKEPQEENKSQ